MSTPFPAYVPFMNPDGTVRVAKGDVTGDGIPEFITGPYGGTSAVPANSMVRVFDQNGTFLTQFTAFATVMNPEGNIDVGLGDLDMDGINEIIVGTGGSTTTPGTNRVSVFDMGVTPGVCSFTAYNSFSNPSGQVDVAGVK